MLNIRTFTLSVVLVAIFVLTVGLVTARPERVSDASSNVASVSEIQERSADPSDAYGASSYRSQFGECFDVSIRELAACRAAGQADPPPVDECFDVSLMEIASCREASQASTP